MLIDKKQTMLLVKQVHSTKFSSIREHSLKFEMRYRMTKEKTFFNIIHLFSQKYLNSVENITSETKYFITRSLKVLNMEN